MPKPSKHQVETLDLIIKDSPEEVVSWMEEDGDMGVKVTEDGASRYGWFTYMGTLVGDWT